MEQGDTVSCIYKTGKYAGEIFELRTDGKTAVVKILAVLKHPLQGDLHQPKKTDVPLFHERRALSFNEKTNIPLSHVKPFNEPLPDYDSSLRKAVQEYEAALQEEDSPYSRLSYETLQQVKASYGILK